MVKIAAVDIREFVRFFVTGIIATLANIAVVWLARRFVSFGTALLVGIFAGITTSFVLSKLFAFSSRSWERASGEAVRFLIVYAVGCALYWAVAFFGSRVAFGYGLAAEAAEMGGILAGAASMTLTSYLGHRFFTYRTYQSATEQLGRAS